MNPPPDTYLTAAEARAKIVACIGGTGRNLFRKWTEGAKPVLPRHYFQFNARPYYSLSELEMLLRPIQREAQPIPV